MNGGSELLNSSTEVPEMTDKSALPEGIGLEETLDPIPPADAESGPDVWDGKLAVFLLVAQQRRPQLLRLANRFANSREEAEDIVQEALLKAFKHLSEFRGESHMGTWLGVIVLNAGREGLRKRKGRVFLPLEYVRNGDDDPIVFDLPDLGQDPEQVCERKEMENILLSEIDELNSVCKSAIRMCALDGLSHFEAASSLGVNVATVKSRIYHGKRMLKRRVCLRTGARELNVTPHVTKNDKGRSSNLWTAEPLANPAMGSA
jgi:RNA polymerase sigma-70 factor (ECF subfamily)